MTHKPVHAGGNGQVSVLLGSTAEEGDKELLVREEDRLYKCMYAEFSSNGISPFRSQINLLEFLPRVMMEVVHLLVMKMHMYM